MRPRDASAKSGLYLALRVVLFISSAILGYWLTSRFLGARSTPPTGAPSTVPAGTSSASAGGPAPLPVAVSLPPEAGKEPVTTLPRAGSSTAPRTGSSTASRTSGSTASQAGGSTASRTGGSTGANRSSREPQNSSPGCSKKVRFSPSIEYNGVATYPLVGDPVIPPNSLQEQKPVRLSTGSSARSSLGKDSSGAGGTGNSRARITTIQDVQRREKSSDQTPSKQQPLKSQSTLSRGQRLGAELSNNPEAKALREKRAAFFKKSGENISA